MQRFAGRVQNSRYYFGRLAARVVRIVLNQTAGLPVQYSGSNQRLPLSSS